MHLFAMQEEKNEMSQKPLSKYMKMISDDYLEKWLHRENKAKNLRCYENLSNHNSSNLHFTENSFCRISVFTKNLFLLISVFTKNSFRQINNLSNYLT